MLRKQYENSTSNWATMVAAGLICFGPHMAVAQGADSVFAPGWTLNADASDLRFQTVKNETTVETSSFGSYAGTIDETGLATVRILTDSVSTNIDLRDVRLRFILFESFQYPEAVITMQIDPADLEDLQDVRRKVMTTGYTIDLHGVTVEREAEIAVTLLDDNTVSVTSSTPISLATADFGLDDGLKTLEETAHVDIIPSATVTFDFMFTRAASADDYLAATDDAIATAGLAVAAVEEEAAPEEVVVAEEEAAPEDVVVAEEDTAQDDIVVAEEPAVTEAEAEAEVAAAADETAAPEDGNVAEDVAAMDTPADTQELGVTEETVSPEELRVAAIAECSQELATISQSNEIYFSRGSSRLDARSNPLLDSVVEIVNRCPELAIRVDGHTDSDGTESANQALSEERALSVQQYLISAGADDSRIDAVGFGETLPIVANDTPENKERNRRIEFSVIGDTPDT